MATGQMKGMDFDQVSQFASRVKSSEIANLDSMVNSVCTAAEALPWSGTDFEKFVAEDVNNVRTQLGNLRTALESMASTASTNAENQRATSAT